jgi:single-strand DNA-binding protein
LVSVDGRLESRKYTDKDGNNREIVEIVADNVNALDRPKEDAEPRQESRGKARPPQGEEYDPFADED